MKTNLLKAEMAKAGYTQEQTARAIGMDPSTFCRKMKKGTFFLKEAERMIILFDIQDPAEIFFDWKGAANTRGRERCNAEND